MSYNCFCDYDLPTFYEAIVRTARKEHSCDECSHTIRPGEKYECANGLWEGHFRTWKTCERCVDIRTWTKNNVPCLCWAHGNMIEDCREAIEAAADRAREETKGLRFGFLRRIALRDRARN